MKKGDGSEWVQSDQSKCLPRDILSRGVVSSIFDLIQFGKLPSKYIVIYTQ